MRNRGNKTRGGGSSPIEGEGEMVSSSSNIRLCTRCGSRPAHYTGMRNGKRRYRTVCVKCRFGTSQPTKRRKRRASKTNKPCASCDFIPKDLCQMDVDHIDGDSTNNSADNLQVLCANCHRLKTLLCQDFLPKAFPSAPPSQLSYGEARHCDACQPAKPCSTHLPSGPPRSLWKLVASLH